MLWRFHANKASELRVVINIAFFVSRLLFQMEAQRNLQIVLQTNIETRMQVKKDQQRILIIIEFFHL